MRRYIDADKIPRHGKRGGECYWQEIEQLPTADVRENVKAEKSISGGMANCDGVTCWFECSACGGSVDISDNFCKHCGAYFKGGTT